MKRPRWLNRHTTTAAVLAVGLGSAAYSVIEQNVRRAGIEAELSTLIGAPVRCGPQADPLSIGFNSADETCVALADAIHLPLGAHAEEGKETVEINGMQRTVHGRRITLVRHNASALTRIHEDAHAGQMLLPTETVPDYVLYQSLREADARLAVVIAAYRRYLQTGERDWWQEARDAEPVMVYVFDRLLARDAASQEALRQNGLPSIAIMQRTAMSYLFSSTANRYMQNQYPSFHANFEERLTSEGLTLTAEQMANGIKREGVSYLLGDPDDADRATPTDRWLLNATLRFALEPRQRAVAATFEEEDLAFVRQQAASDIVDEDTLAQQRLNFRRGRAPLWHAYVNAGLMNFYGQLHRPDIDAPSSKIIAGLVRPAASPARTAQCMLPQSMTRLGGC